MKLRYRILAGLASVFVVGLLALAWAIGHRTDCTDLPVLPAADAEAVATVSATGTSTQSTSAPATMRAIVRRCYGPPDVIEYVRLPKPALEDDRVLVRVEVASINPADWHTVRGEPYLMRLDTGFGAPKEPRVGIDFAGVVEAVGRNVTRFKPGDAVFGARNGALAEYVNVREQGSITLRPEGVTAEQAVTLPVAAITALQALREHGRVKAGQKVLINGASGGVGSFAVQLAKYMGASVTGVSSGRNVELVRSLGADRVIDYTREDFTQDATRYDVIIDNVGNRPIGELRRVLAPEGRYVLVGGGGPDEDPWIGALAGPIRTIALSPFVKQDLIFFVAETTAKDLAHLAKLMQEGRLRAVIDRRFPLAESEAAMLYLETGRARGKVIVEIG